MKTLKVSAQDFLFVLLNESEVNADFPNSHKKSLAGSKIDIDLVRCLKMVQFFYNPPACSGTKPCSISKWRVHQIFFFWLPLTSIVRI